MRIVIQCPGCAATWRASEEAADRRLTCPRCGRLFKVPKLEDLSEATDLLRQTRANLYVDPEGRLYG